MQENWDRISHLLSNQYKGDAFKNSLFKNLSYIRTDITERSETRIVLGVPSDLERQLIQRIISKDIIVETNKLIPSQFALEFEITGLQTTFPAPIINQVPEPVSEVVHLPKKIEVAKQTIDSSDYSIEETIVGVENQLLMNAAERMISSPRDIPFPLLITGSSGVGKSHHAKVIYTELKKIYSADRVKLLTGERFLTDFLEHIKTKQTWKFQKKYRNDTDVIIFDDISCLKSAKKTQEEFLALLDYFYAHRKTVIVTLPCSPDELIGLEPAISSRLTSGLHITLEKPSASFRQSFIENQFEKLSLNIEKSCQDLIVQNASCFRQLKGYINKINFIFAGRSTLISTGEINGIIKLTKTSGEFKTPDEILAFTSEKFKVEVVHILSKSRLKKYVTARNYAICLMRDKLGLSMQEIGRHVGYRDHSTIRHALLKSTSTN